jgi:hypothetical protein
MSQKIDHVFRRELHAALDRAIDRCNSGGTDVGSFVATKRPGYQFVAGMLVTTSAEDWPKMEAAAGINDTWYSGTIHEEDPQAN